MKPDYKKYVEDSKKLFNDTSDEAFISALAAVMAITEKNYSSEYARAKETINMVCESIDKLKSLV